MAPSSSDEDYSSLTQVSPALTEDKLNSALSEWFKETVVFTRWEYVGEIGKGDSYLSEVRKIRIHGITRFGVDRNVQVILKTIPRNICRRLTFRSDEFFRNEIAFYTNVLPNLLLFQSEKNATEPFNNNVKLFLTHCDGLNDCICLEDVSVQGYGNIIRQQTIDLQHCIATIKTLAKFHALSFAMKDQRPEKFAKISNEISETYFDYKLWDWYKRFWDRICTIAIDAIEKEYPDSIYLKKIKSFAVKDTYFKMISAVRDKQHAVISHGDPWTNNFLYKYNNDITTKIIDFQLSRYSSPVLDLSYFIYNSTSQELRVKYYDELLRSYYEVLSSQIKNMGSDPDRIYSRETFLNEVKRYSFFGLVASFEMTPLIVLEPEEAFDLEIESNREINIDEMWNIGPIKSKENRRRAADNVVHCVDNGYI
ncbi:PREDICTED: uncharacterized protein LOC106103224 [Papilio polytes]|uniref:uncharacterized protein LOC106103224 n=1 Tax=Papilio polytes TaxID=76194 RepID=UPI0006765704|nr:PREDICTED: uncharacterized protein LOC106103224 [Papilio polytes]